MTTRAAILLWVFVSLTAYWLLSRAPDAVQAAGPGAEPPPDALADKFRLEPVARAKQPVYLCAAPGDASGRLFVVEKVGRIRLLRDGKLSERPFLDIADRVSGASEQGLLGLAFHPEYAKNRLFYIHFTDRKGDTRVVELATMAGDPERANPESERELLFVDQPFVNHNGGHLAFGPDGRLYVGLGDGGGAGDRLEKAQDRKSLLGKMLRLDVDAKPAPPPEMWQIGLRNPWRYAFDRKTGDLYIADVGQDRYEEVHVVPASSKGGENFGWNIVEGIGHCFKRRDCDQTGLVQPVVEYGHPEGCSITGGYVYRGKALPELDGCYFYADYCSALVRSFRWKDGKVSDHWDWRANLDPESRLATVSSFGEDAAGELYVLSLDGPIYKLVRATVIR